MANNFVVPFDNNPVSSAETASSYTVPAGKYAIVNVTLSAEARPTDEANASTTSAGDVGGGFGGSSDSSATTLTLRLSTGQVLTKTETAASSTVSTSATATGETAMTSGTSVATVLVDGVAVGTIKASATAYVNEATAAITIGTTGSALVTWHAAEYNNIS